MRRIKILLSVLSMIIVMVVSSWSSPRAPVPMQQVAATSTSAMPSSKTKSWLIINLPPNATQLQYGSEIYRLVCSACHGDKGQGLTNEWRSTWAPADQNCWQSKCHAANHPPDGFSLPVAPAVVGSTAMARFYTASDLHKFISTYMPWQDPGNLTEEEYWQVTAYILQMNNIDSGGNLNAQTAIQIKLGRSQSSLPLEETQADRKGTFYILALAVALLVLLASLSLKLNRMIRK